jgi:hypothetical protein
MLNIMDELADQIRGVLTGQLASTNIDLEVVSGRAVGVTPPVIDVFPGAASRDTESRMFADDYDGGGYLFTVRARIAPNDQDATQRLLYEFMDDGSSLSIAQAITDDPTLGGYAAGVDCIDPTGEQIYGEFGTELLGFQFTARVLAAYS